MIMDLTLRDHKFDGKDPIKVLRIFAEQIRKCKFLSVTEGLELISLSYMLNRDTKEKLNSVLSTSEKNEYGIECWPEAVQYLLRTYETTGEIRESILKFLDSRQRDEDY